MVEFPYRQGGLNFNLSIDCSVFVSALSWAWLRKGLDFNLVGAGTDPNSGCLGSVDWHSLSALLAVSLLISGGAIPASRCRLVVLVGLRQPVMVRQALFRAGSNLLACTDLDHTGHAYSANRRVGKVQRKMLQSERKEGRMSVGKDGEEALH